MNKLPELLAPAGTLESLKAAIHGGADAVYFGVPRFNARMRAKNFTPDELDEAFSLCALYGVKTHVTLNTLLYGREFKSAMEVVDELEKCYRPDAYIVQDLGLARELKRKFPDIVLHASTQAELHNAFGAEAFVKLGFSRAVIAREVSEAELKAFADFPIETEIFVHGAMCVCQSGGCLMSSLIGGRSGNRGECAYPCRLPYKGKNPYPLSLKDMCLASHIPEIISLGVDALKIEGRMKPPEYVYEVTSLYRRLLDGRRAATADELAHQQAVFSRSGFTDGYFTSRITPAMFGVRSEDDKKSTRSVKTEIVERKIPITVCAEITKGNASASFTCRGVTATVGSEGVSEAKTLPLTKDEAASRLCRLGSTPFCANGADVTVGDGLFMTAGALNELRRAGTDKLTEALKAARTRQIPLPLTLEEGKSAAEPPSGLIIRMGLHANEKHAQTAESYEVPLEKISEWSKLAANYGDRLCAVIPRTVYDSQRREVCELLSRARALGVRRVCVENIEHLSLADGFEIYGGLGLNVTNIHTYEVLRALGISRTVISPEASMALAAESGGGYTVYGRLPLMHTRSCIIKNVSGCSDVSRCGSCRAPLKDRTNSEFEVVGGFGHTNTIYNSVPLWLFDKPITTKSPLIYFTTETPDEEDRVLAAYFEGAKPSGAFTRGRV